ncbi:hypothetical protein H0H81_001576 [Sphagnurus paluster]|uniref:Uncharacterized protein n=1 Tax=Sphagnurus paluster TaxID=117069 RepID=A0A9P7FYF9_9AGAR|nr:hypothetical protein H0H81_001576 [Sphagnurus paluster]
MRPVLPTTVRHAVLRRVPAKGRFSSTNQSVETAQQKAKDALGSAQKNAGKALEGVSKFLGPLGQRAGNLLGAYREPLVYNLSVAREVLKQIYRTEGLAPPSLSTIQGAYKTLWTRATDVAYLRNIAGSGELVRAGVYAVEAYGIFKEESYWLRPALDAAAPSHLYPEINFA